MDHIAPILLIAVTVLVLLFFLSTSVDNKDDKDKVAGENDAARSRSQKIPREKDVEGTEALKEMILMNTLVPILSNQTAIMFWRPQKVGSSTLLSLLVSYGYRYNLIPRRKAPMNSLCIKIAQCALERNYYSGFLQSAMKSNNNNRMDPNSPSRQMGRLINYVKHKRYGAGGAIQGSRAHAAKREQLAESQIYSISASHQMCNLPPTLIQSQLNCAFTNHTSAVLKRMSLDSSSKEEKHLISMYRRHQQVITTGTVRELFVVREPLARAVSIYYFWGELYKLHAARNARPRPELQSEATRLSKKTRQQIRLGQTGGNSGVIKKNPVIHGSFEYHGDEMTVPPANIAMAFAKHLPYTAGMPAPSFTWSSFADSVQSAVQEIKTDRIMTVVTERLDESLVVASHYLGWSLADVVVSLPRKALSSHPKWQQWPSLAVQAIRTFLEKSGETLLYNEANLKLDQRIVQLKVDGIDFDAELRLLQSLRSRVEKLCLSQEYLERYRSMLSQEGYTQHQSNNKLRDAADEYVDGGHAFSFNSDMLFTYDVCSPCEAHAILLAINSGRAKTVDEAPLLKDLDQDTLQTAQYPPHTALALSKCPRTTNISRILNSSFTPIPS